MASAITTPGTLHNAELVPHTVSREEYLRTIYHPDCDFVDVPGSPIRIVLSDISAILDEQ